MEENTKEKEPKPKRRSVAGKIARILFKIVLSIILLVAVIALAILTPPVQNFIKNKATTWLSKKLDTKVAIGRIYIGFPKKIVLENIYIEDRQKDTLLAGGALKVDISMLKLLKSEVEVSQIQLSELTAKVKRVLPDTIYNFQFIIDAFATNDTTTKTPSDSSSMKISLGDVELDKIRLVYDDAVAGNDITLWLEHFDTEIDEFDLDKMRFNIAETNIEGINANVYQRKPLVEIKEAVDTTVSEPIAIDVDFGRFKLKDIKLDYGNDVSAMYAKLDLGEFNVESEDIDLREQLINLDNIELNGTKAVIRMGKVTHPVAGAKSASVSRRTAGATPPKEGIGKIPDTIIGGTSNTSADTVVNNWRVFVKNIRLNENDLAFADDNSPVIKKGIDYSHIDAKDVTIHIDDFLFATDSIAGKITKGSLTEKSGLALNTFETEFLYAANQAYLKDMLIETPGTQLKRSLNLKYPSIESLQKDIGQLQMDIDLDNSKIQVKDILIFAPFLGSQPAFSNPQASLLVDGNITGRVANMNINNLKLKAFNNTNVDVRGNIKGLPDANKLRGNLVINNISTSRRDIELLAPKGSLPTNITLPEIMNLKGSIAGSMNDARANLNLNTNLGSASVKGTISNPTDSIRAKYDALITANNLNLGVIMQNDTMYGPLTATIAAKGTGFTPKRMTADLNGKIISAVYNKYNYKNVNFTGTIAKQKGKLQLEVDDPNITVNLAADADLSREFPAISLKTTIDTINVTALNFTKDTLAYKGIITANFANTDPANLEGKLFVTGSRLTSGTQNYQLDTISVVSGKNEKGKFLTLNSTGIYAALTGKYNLAQLGSVFTQAIQPYYALDSVANKDTIDAYDFNFTAQIINHPTFKAFLPTLERLDPIKIDGHFATGNGFTTNLDAPLIIIGTNRIQKLKLNAGTSNEAININTTLEQLAIGQSMMIYGTSLDAKIADNKIDFQLNLKDQENKNKYRLAGLFAQPQPGVLTISLDPATLLLNYDKWNVSKDNVIKMNNGDINISNFVISRNNQQLSIASSSAERNSPMEVKFGNFKIGTITAFAKQDTALADGLINGNVLVKNIAEQPVFTSDITVTDLMFKGDTVGNLALKVNNNTPNVYAADINLTGKGNDIAINGDYTMNPGAAGVMDMSMAIKRLEMSTVEALALGAVSGASGYLTGNFTVRGTFDKPDVDGDLTFNQTYFTPSMLGSAFSVDKETIRINDEGIHFDSFIIRDSSKNELELDGWARTNNFTNYKLDLNLTADNFQALNSTKQNSKLFYGQFYFDTDLHISGTETNPKVDGSLTVNDKTNVTIIMPQASPGIVEREGIVRFIDVDSIRADTVVQLTATDSLSKSDITGMDISVNIETSKKAGFTLIIDEANGDFVNIRGAAQLTGGIDPSGKTTLTGNYEIEEGSYQLAINLLKRKFEIQKGSKITWLGEPTRADVDITAIYVANTAPITLVEDQANVPNLNMYKQKIPFNVNLKLKGELLKPEVAFDVTLPDEDSVQFNVSAEVTDLVDARLNQLRAQPSELNKQVFALLLLNRFIAENPFASSGDAATAGSIARQSVSRILTEQLNSLAADLIKGVDLNFDLASTEDYTTGSKQDRTDLNVSVSKQLLNDRLRVTVGNNFELEGPQNSNQRGNNLAGNVALDYLLSKDGRYMIRGYRKNQYEGELDGYIIETGLNFILTFDYDRLRELFHSPKEKKTRKSRKAKS